LAAEQKQEFPMARGELNALSQLVAEHEKEILQEWVDLLKKSGSLQTGRIKEAELQTQCRGFLEILRTAIAKGGANFSHTAYDPVRQNLELISRSRATQGFSPSETATFIFSLKQPLFNTINKAKTVNPQELAAMVWSASLLLDELGLYTIEIYQQTREEIVVRQQREIAELSTPVVKLWDSILALPLIGTLDSQRTQVVMENLLQALVDHEAEIAIIDITGVPTVDTLTAQHLLRTVAAARLMGADCIISGIRPQIAQTIVHLGVDLNVVTKATLADAFSIALRRVGRTVASANTAAKG
jgi:rsbT co-antagonist protein RsbR